VQNFSKSFQDKSHRERQDYLNGNVSRISIDQYTACRREPAPAISNTPIEIDLSQYGVPDFDNCTALSPNQMGFAFQPYIFPRNPAAFFNIAKRRGHLNDAVANALRIQEQHLSSHRASTGVCEPRIHIAKTRSTPQSASLSTSPQPVLVLDWWLAE
jgi:hypothetical protein